MRNKKGDAGDFLNFVGFFIILLVLSMGIVIGYVIFFGGEYDFRQAEADVLFVKARECFGEKNFSDVGFDFRKECNMNGNVEDDVMILFDNNAGMKFRIGEDMEVLCELNDKSDTLPKCTNGIVWKDSIAYKITTASNRRAERSGG
jgi:hypothetical protein